MARKSYSSQDRQQVRERLLEAGLELASQRGLRHVHLLELTEAAGISKPFFYSFYPSLEEFFLDMFLLQRQRLREELKRRMEEDALPWEERVHGIFRMLVFHRENHVALMTQEDEVAFHRALTPERLAAFREGQRAFFREIAAILDLPETVCDPLVLGNLLLSAVLFRNSAQRSFPFLVQERVEETAEFQLRMLVCHLSRLRERGGAPPAAIPQ